MKKINHSEKIRRVRVTFWNGPPLNHFYVGGSRWKIFKYRVHRTVRKGMILTIVALMLFIAGVGLFTIGAKASQVSTDFLTQNVLRQDPPVINRIGSCEHWGVPNKVPSQYDQYGQVLLHGNSDGTVDIGAYAINQRWESKAKELGYSLSTYEGNHAMMLWIYWNRGTGDWTASEKCWELR